MSQPDNSFGTYIRSRRKALGMTIADLAKRSEYSVGYISRLELGQADGPSSTALERLAQGLGCDVTVLLRLKDAGTQTPELPAGTKSDLEREMIEQFRTADDRVQRYLIEQAQLSQMLLGRADGPPDARHLLDRIKPDAGSNEKKDNKPDVLPSSDKALGARVFGASTQQDESHLDRHLLQLAGLYEDIGNDLLMLKHFSEAVDAYSNAENVYKRYEERGALARLHFFIGRTHRLRELQLLDNPSENVRWLQTAEYYFARADQEFKQVGVLALTDAQRERYPENLADWSRAINRIGYWICTNEKDLTVDDRTYVRRSSRLRAQVKLEEARKLTEEWIGELLHRSVACPTEAPARGKTEELLAEAYHRMAIIYQGEALLFQKIAEENSLGGQMTDPDGRNQASGIHAGVHAFEMSRENFRQAISRRKDFVRAASTSEEKGLRLDRLANTHQNLGWTIQHCCAEEQQYEMAAWQYAVAHGLNQLNETYPNQAQEVYLKSLGDSLVADVSPDLDAAMQRIIETMLTPERLSSLEYEVEFPFKQSPPMPIIPNRSASESKPLRIDDISKLPDKTAFLRRLAEDFNRAYIREEPLSLVLIDVNYLKNYNKLFGYNAGNKLLEKLGFALTKSLRREDFAARMGSDDFAVILPQTTQDGAKESVERLRQSVTAELKNISKESPSISIGVASLTPNITNVTDLLEAASQAIFLAKRAGNSSVS